MITRDCLECGSEFQTRQVDINRGHGKFCSRSCAAFYSRRPNKKEFKEHNCTCVTCNKTFYRNNTQLKNSKSGLVFCSRKCKEFAQRLTSGFTVIQPDHYGSANGKHNYREIALRDLEHPACNRCGYDTYPEILQVHHKDHDRSNNEISNLEVVCPNCHAIEHHVKLPD